MLYGLFLIRWHLLFQPFYIYSLHHQPIIITLDIHSLHHQPIIIYFIFIVCITNHSLLHLTFIVCITNQSSFIWFSCLHRQPITSGVTDCVFKNLCMDSTYEYDRFIKGYIILVPVDNAWLYAQYISLSSALVCLSSTLVCQYRRVVCRVQYL